jgi:vacuolar-type H+-ATPase subunit I/STV1
MKTSLTLAILVVLALTPAVMADSPISEIRSEYQAIRNALPKLRVEQLELSGYSTEGGVAKAYRDPAEAIRFLRVERYFESGKVLDEYYFKNGLLIFTYEEEHHYNVPFNVTPETAKKLGIESFDPTKTRIVENRYYFQNRKMIRWIGEKKKEVNPTSKEFRQKEKETLEFVDEILAKFKPKT